MRTPFGRRRADPGADWAEAALGPIRGLGAEVDVTRRVMLRIEARRPAPLPSILPASWERAAYAASALLGVAALALLIATAGAMMSSGDPGARGLVALLGSGWSLAWSGATASAGILLRLGSAALALLRGVWALLEWTAPLARGAGSIAAFGGALSIALSVIVVAQARRTAPVVPGPDLPRPNGGF